eukprot:TRINITY_DN2488_c0_g1_i1.p1 TRINITY_DN2488_c0_g1~~TRINITY_DN2488_c0_g1_i1.p1  ORF type:complete len:315 (+),score=75.42 TRINITY_DN2488_c0_g1_i1:357-1301(+)
MTDRRDSLKWNFRRSVGSLVIDDSSSPSLHDIFASSSSADGAGDSAASVTSHLHRVPSTGSSGSSHSPVLYGNHDEIEIRGLQAKLDEARQTIQILIQTKNAQEIVIAQLMEENRRLRENQHSHNQPSAKKENVSFLNALSSSSTTPITPELQLNKQFKFSSQLNSGKSVSSSGIPPHHGIQLEHGDEDEDDEEQYGSAVSEDEYGTGLEKHFPGLHRKSGGGGVSTSICRHFLKGRCRYKASCRFSHEVEKCPYCHEVLPISKVSASAHLGRCWKLVEQQELGGGKAMMMYDDHDQDDEHLHHNKFLYLHKDR